MSPPSPLEARLATMFHMACCNCENLIDSDDGWHIIQGEDPSGQYGGKSFCDELCVYEWLKRKGFDQVVRKT